MELPFTPAEFFDVFRRYNQAVWPVQLIWIGAACAALLLVRNGSRRGTRSMLLVLSALWLWIALVYHAWFFRQINPAATIFAALFVGQAALLFVHGLRAVERIRPTLTWAGVAGWLAVVYGLIVYPLLGAALGHRYPASPTFGLPCPTTLFTLGVLLWMRPVRLRLFVIPLIWTALGTVAALELGVHEDLGLAVAALMSMAVLMKRRHSVAEPGHRSVGA
ncbi:MAG TPA: DUF6064 family protein [Longimicrobiales bacterium]